MSTKITIWDSFIRGYHWLQAISIAGLWYTGTEGLMDWHFSIAYGLLALLVTRLIWGVLGSETAKLSRLFTLPALSFNTWGNCINPQLAMTTPLVIMQRVAIWYSVFLYCLPYN